ncbi:MAG: YhjD/YihY/BrkB family envelope integrity protein [Hyphomicrobiales bacterium]
MAAVQKRVHGIYAAIRDYFQTGLWMQRLEDLPRWRAASVRTLRILTAAVTEFFADQCSLRASALTFYTLLSIVPVFAVVFGIAKGFGLDKVLEKELMEQMAGQEQALERILAFSRNMLENTKGGLIAGVGVVLMFWSAIKVLGQIESSLNAMWDVRGQRSWGRRFSDYLAVLLIAPILLLVAGSASVFIRTQFDAIAGRFEIVGMLGPLVLQTLKLTPLILVWALFTLVYMALPNTRVRFGAAAAGAAVGGLMYQLVQWFYIDLQVGVAKQNAIYGSFAALPLFLAWVQASWTIVLFGAELCEAVQHSSDSCRSLGCPAPSAAEKKLIGLNIVHEVIRRFAAGDPPMTAHQLALGINLPVRWVKELLAGLTATGILSETRGASADEPGYQPAMDIGLLTLQRVSEALESGGGSAATPILPIEETAKLAAALRELSRAAAESRCNRLLKDI